ncbi:MAG: hypothetical protein ACLGIR_11370 [Actinomycetes bacterium]
MASFHRWVGYTFLGLLLVLLLWGVGMRLLRREQAPNAFWAVQHWTENLLVVQTVVGILLLVLGRRVVGHLAWLHYFYGSLFPLVAIVGGRIAALRRERHDYVGVAWGAFFAAGLASRALLTGLGIGT